VFSFSSQSHKIYNWNLSAYILHGRKKNETKSAKFKMEYRNGNETELLGDCYGYLEGRCLL
jgi:hypothetical protein